MYDILTKLMICGTIFSTSFLADEALMTQYKTTNRYYMVYILGIILSTIIFIPEIKRIFNKDKNIND